MARIRLLIDVQREQVWGDPDTRHTAQNLTNSLTELLWEVKPTAGGLWDGSATVRLTRGGELWQKLVEQGKSGAAWIFWDRVDAGDASDISADQGDDGTDFLWLGQASSAEVMPTGNLVKIKLRGAGHALEDLTYTGEFASTAISTIADTVLATAIAASDGERVVPIKAKDVEISGVLARKITVSYDNKKISEILKELQKFAGGPPKMIYGLEPGTQADEYCRAYVRQWKGHLYDRDATSHRSYGFDKRQILDFKITADASKIVNSAKVIGMELGEVIQTDETVTGQTEKIYAQAEVESAESVKLFGKRHQVVMEQDLATDGQCAIHAAGIVKAGANREITVQAKSLARIGNLESKDAGATDHLNVVSSCLHRPGPLVLFRNENRPPLKWMDSTNDYRAGRSAGDARFLKVDLSATDYGTLAADYLICPNLRNRMGAGKGRLFVFRMDWDNTTYSSQGLNVMEMDRQFGLFLYDTGAGAWSSRVAYYQNSTTNWKPTTNSETNTVTTAAIEAEHLIAVQINDNGGSASTDAYIYHITTAGAVTRIGSHAAEIPTATVKNHVPPAWFINAARTNGSAPATPGDCGTANYRSGAVFNSITHDGTTDWTQATIEGALAKMGNNPGPPFRRWKELVGLTQFGITNSSGHGFVRIGMGQTAYSGGYLAKPEGAAVYSQITDSATITNGRLNTWLLGDRRKSERYGSHVEVLPTSAKFATVGKDAPVSVTIKGQTDAVTATDYLEGLRDSLSAVEENSRQ